MVLFKQLMEMKQYKNALGAIMDNSEEESRKNCLRHFLATLVELGQLHTVTSLQYGCVEGEVGGW